VAPDGSICVTVEPDPAGVESEDVRARALRFGWGETLALARRGVDLVAGAGLVDPSNWGALVVRGAPHEIAIVIIALAERGWLLLADRVLPILVGGDVVIAEPHPAPVLLPGRRAARAGVHVVDQARGDSDAVLVDLPRADRPAPVCATVEVSLRRPHEAVLEVLDGHRRVESAATLVISGVLGEVGGGAARPPAEEMQRHLRLSRLPTARWRLDESSLDADVETMVQWWKQCTLPADPS
jgi:hypothetical protein